MDKWVAGRQAWRGQSGAMTSTMTMRSTYRAVSALMLVASATAANAQSNRRPMPVPDADVVDPALDTRSPDARKLEVAAVANARTLPELSAGMARVCRLQSWQFALVPLLNRAVRMDVSPTLGKGEQECLRSVVYASRYHFNRR
jgi:hypothetical protein